VHAAVLAGLGVPDNGRLLNIEPRRELPGRGAVVFFETYPNFLRLRDWRHDAFTAVTCIQPSVVGWDDHGEIRPLQAARVTASFFTTMGVPPFIGQPFTAADDGVTAAPVAVISHQVWMAAFAGDAHAVGQSLRLAGVPHTVAGVMPPGFALPATTDVWLPLGTPSTPPSGRIFSVYARLKPGAPQASADAAMADFTRRAAAEDAVMNRDYHYRARPLREALLDDAGRAIWLVQAGALLLFALAISNVWSLVLAWAFERRHETAVRRALGASARDIGFVFARRSLTLAIPAGLLGASIAWAVLPFVRQLHPTPQLGFLLAGAHLSMGALAAAVGLTLVAALAIGLVPAWQAWREDPAAGLSATSRGATLSRSAAHWQRAMVLVQAALTVMVLFAAVVSGMSFWKLAAVPNGFDPSGRLIVHVMLPEARFPTHPSRALFGARLLEEGRREPAIGSLAFTTTLPVGDLRWGARFYPELPNGEIAREPVQLHLRRVSPGYLNAMGIPLLRGRDIEPRDVESSARVAVVSLASAARLWPGKDPLGRRLRRFVNGAPDPVLVEVVGLTGDAMDGGYNAPPGEAIYLPYAQMSGNGLSLVVRPRTTDAEALAAVRRALKTADPTIAASDIATLGSMVSDARAVSRLQMMLLTAFGLVALSLTALGSYGVMTQLVASRERELAVRLAIGATPRQVGSMVLGQNARLALMGIALGLMAAWQAGRLLEPIVFGISATSPGALAAVALTTLTVTLCATIAPAIRAALVDVTRGLRG
jgi:putative ABC transport system permease protein